MGVCQNGSTSVFQTDSEVSSTSVRSILQCPTCLRHTLYSVRFILENQCDFGRIAQLVEHLAVNQDVEGSSPSPSSMNCGITLRSMPGVSCCDGNSINAGCGNGSLPVS